MLASLPSQSLTIPVLFQLCLEPTHLKEGLETQKLKLRNRVAKSFRL